MYDRLLHEFPWPHMAADAKHIASECHSCAWNNPTYRQKRKPQLFSAVELLDLFAIDMLGPFSKITQHNHYIFVITDRFSKLKRVIITSENMSTPTANLFFGYWTVLGGISTFLFTDSGV